MIRTCLVLAGLLLAFQATGEGNTGPSRVAPVTAFINVNVVPMDRERVLPAQTVIVQGEVIAAVGPVDEVPIPRHGTHIDGRGSYLIPGLAEMHGHLPGPGDAREDTENSLFLYLANGVTLLRGMQGHPQQLRLRREIASGALPGPRLLVSSPPLSGRTTTSAAAAREQVQEAVAAGYDHIKVHEGLAPGVYDALAETATALHMPFAGHVPNQVGLFHALRAGQQTIDHLDNYVEALVDDHPRHANAGVLTPAALAARVDESNIPRLVAATVEAGAAVVPTLALWEHFFGDAGAAELRRRTPGLRYMPRRTVDRWAGRLGRRNPSPANADIIQLRRKILKALSDGGAAILFGTDSPQLFSVPGFSIHREMAIMQEAGMTPWEILQSATSAVARFYGEEDKFGRVAPGMRADLVLVTGNPLEDIGRLAKPAGVMVKGRWLDGNYIQKRLTKIAESYGN